MKTTKLITRALKGQGTIAEVQATAIERGWTPELFQAQVRKVAAQLQSTAKRSASQKVAVRVAPRIAPSWNVTERRLPNPTIVPVSVLGPVFTGPAVLTLTHERTSVRADGVVFQGASGTVGQYPVRLSQRAIERIADRTITVFIGGRAHKVTRTA